MLLIYLVDCLWYVLPVLLAGLAFIITCKRGWFGFLDVPVAEKAFGRNKTWRGFLLMPVYCLISVWLIALFAGGKNEIYAAADLSKSLLLGLCYPLGELPNSFVKRRLGIGPGERSSRKIRAGIFLVWDNIDSVLACAAAAVLIYGMNAIYFPGILALGSLFHFSTDVLMVRLKLKPRQGGR